MVTRTAKLGTTNKHGFEHAPDDQNSINIEFDVEVPESVSEAVEFFGGEEKALDVLQQEVIRRKVNAARPAIRDAESELDWVSVATQIASQYEPGRRGGFAPSLDKADVVAAASSSAEDLLALLASRGITLK